MTKGIISEYSGSLLLAIAAVVLVFLALLSSIGLYYVASTEQTSVTDFLKRNVEPYTFAAVLANYMAGDRQFLEQAIEIVVGESKKNASSLYLSGYVKNLIRSYDDYKTSLVAVSIRNEDGKEILSIDNRPKRCGDGEEGLCVNPVRTRHFERQSVDYYVGCGTGRKKIDASLYTNPDNRCADEEEICCVEDVDASGNYNGPEIVRCGPITSGIRLGICDTQAADGTCGYGRVEIDNVDNVCTGGYPCCLPATPALLTSFGRAASAEIPLLYRGDKFGKVEVTVA